jgi:hypothetical protein
MSVRLSLDNDSNSLQPGTLAQVSVVLEEREDVLWVPPGAIRNFQGRTFVILQNGARQHRVDIETGIESMNQVEILNGLEQGQIIAAP